MSQEEQRITRRSFSQQAVSGMISVGAIAGLANAKQPERFRLNYILASPMYGTSPLHEVVPEISRIGADVIDIWPRSHANHREQMDQIGFDAVERLLSTHDSKLGMITRYDLGPYRITEEINTLKRFGGKLLVCGAKSAPGETTKEQVRSFIKSMKPHLDEAERHEITLGIENHSNTLLSSPDSIKYFAEFATSPYLGLAMAPYHLPQDPLLIAELIQALGPQLVFFQAWQHGHGCMQKLPKEEELLQMPGRGDLDFRPVLGALRRIDYRGWTEIFMHPVPRGVPILDSTREVTQEINRSRAYLDRCLPTA